MQGGDHEEEAVPTFRKPLKRNKNVRARSGSIDEEDGPAAASTSGVVRPQKVAKANPMVSSSGSGSGGSGGGSTSLRHELAHASDRRISNFDNKATATNEQDIDRNQDAQAQFEAARKMWEDGGDVAADGSKVYRGQKAYRQYTEKAESFDSQVNKGAGPARAPVHFRAISRFDYQPDICKDYKETGFCGYGDACVFLHDRSDYKSGWQLEKQWEQQQRERAHAAALQAFEGAERGGTDLGSSTSKANADEERLPFACLLCREPWHAKSAPVVTKCEHYFCEACALKHAAKTKRCFVCAENTGGIFNKAKAIQEKINRQAAAEAQDAVEQSDESILAEYEEAKKKTRGTTNGWAFV